MNVDVPWMPLAIGLLVVVALFFLIRSFKMPSTFNKNQEEREKLQKKIKDFTPPP